MSFRARLVHTLTIRRTAFEDVDPDDEYGQPVEATTTVTTPGLIQPRTAQELADSRSAGAEIADHVIFLEPQLLYNSDVILDEQGQEYRIDGIRSFEFGRTPHLEVDVFAVVRSNDNVVAVGS